jgi:hypothetical protein
MKKALTYSAIVLLLGLTACNKTDNMTFEGDGNIRFAPARVATRALIEDADGLQSQTFKVYDILNETEYINNTIVYNETDGWTYGTPATYKWADGEHKFFGFTDGAGAYADNLLAVSKTLTTAEADQVDLLYSDIFTTTAADWKATKTAKDSVMLDFHHLFAAVSITVLNETTNDVSVASVGTDDIRNSGSATVNYSGSDVAVQYGSVSTSGNYGATAFSSAIALGENEMIDVFGQAKTQAKNFCVVWPQSLEGNAIVVDIDYTMNDDNFVKHVTLPTDTWEAGKKYSYTLRILPTGVKLTFKVMPWIAGEAGSINTEDGSINMSNVNWMNTKLKLTENAESTVNTVNNGGRTVMMFYEPWVKKVVNETESWEQYDGFYPAQAYFTVNYPLSGQYKIGLIPAYGQTTVDLTAYEIWVYDATVDTETGKPIGFVRGDSDTKRGEYVGTIPEDHSTIYFQVRASAAVEAATSNPEYRAQVDIWFKPDGSDEWVSAYSEVRANYAAIIPAR